MGSFPLKSGTFASSKNVCRKNWILDPLEILMEVIGVARIVTVTMLEASLVTGVLLFNLIFRKCLVISLKKYVHSLSISLATIDVRSLAVIFMKKLRAESSLTRKVTSWSFK